MKSMVKVACHAQDKASDSVRRFSGLSERLFDSDGVVAALGYVPFVGLSAVMFIDVATTEHYLGELNIIDLQPVGDIDTENLV